MQHLHPYRHIMQAARIGMTGAGGLLHSTGKDVWICPEKRCS